MADESRINTILDAAENAFMDFGPKHTSMEDIASKAGLSRPALYQYFKNRNDLFRAVVNRLHRNSLNLVAEHLEQKGSLENQLTKAILARDGALFTMLKASPHADAIIDLHEHTAGDVTLKANTLYLDLMAARMGASGLSEARSKQVAKLLVAMSTGLKAQSADLEEFHLNIAEAVNILIAGVDVLE